MTALQILNEIKEGISQKYLCDSNILEEPGENMKLELSPQDENFVLIKPQDSEKEHLWRVFADNINDYIADYILYEVIGDDVICFILELKKTKTKQIHLLWKTWLLGTWFKINGEPG